jgi:hypothetical protein
MRRRDEEGDARRAFLTGIPAKQIRSDSEHHGGLGG